MKGDNQMVVIQNQHLQRIKFLIDFLIIGFILGNAVACSRRPSNLPDNQNATEPTIEENNDTKEEELYKILWQFTAKEDSTSAPIISEGKVIFVGDSGGNVSNTVYAVDQKTGSLVWEHKLDTRPSEYIAESQGLVFVGCNEKLVALDTKTGNTKWEFSDNPEEWHYYSYPVTWDQLVIVNKLNPLQVENKDCIFVLDAFTGTLKWKKRIDGLLQRNLPVIANGLLYYGTNAPGQKGKIFAVDVLTGQEKWHYQASTIWLDQPVANEQIVCFQPEGNELIALDALTGQEKWQFTPDKGLSFHQFNPSITNDMVYIAYPDDPNGSYLYGIDILTGKAKWRSYIHLNASFNASTVVYLNIVYISSFEGSAKSVFALDGLTGKIIWEFLSLESIYNITIHQGILYIHTQMDKKGSTLIALQDLNE